MHVPINVNSPNNISKWQMRFNSAFKGLISNLNVVRDVENDALILPISHRKFLFVHITKHQTSFIHSFSSLSYDRSKAFSKASSPHSAI
jgi:hypothetical protein